ncbi:MAG: glycosyltransferase family 39 protein [Acidimicrobiales bacterium]
MTMAVDVRRMDTKYEATNEQQADAWRGPVLVATALIAVMGGMFLGARHRPRRVDLGRPGTGSWEAFRIGVGEDGGSQSLYFLLVRGVTAVFGDAPWVIRLPALLGAMAIPYPLYRLVQPRLGRDAAFRALIFLAVAYTFVANAQEGRAYTVLAAILTWTWFALDRALETATLRAWLKVGALAALSLYAQPLGIPVLIGQALWVLLHRRQVVGRYFVAAGSLAAVLAAPLRLPDPVRGRRSHRVARHLHRWSVRRDGHGHARGAGHQRVTVAVGGGCGCCRLPRRSRPFRSAIFGANTIAPTIERRPCCS